MFVHGSTVKESLRRTFFLFQQAGLDDPGREARFLFSQVLGWEGLRVFLEADTVLSPGQLARLQEAVARRAKGEPLAYITGSRDFYGLEFRVSPAVLIPRPESEFLIDMALEWARRMGYDQGKGIQLVDLGTGSGNLAITLAVKWPLAQVSAVDISPQALALAKENALRHRVQNRISWYCGDYFSAFDAIAPSPQFNLVISNPPYIPHGELAALSLTVRAFEPVVALDGGGDGLVAYRELLSGLPPHLLSPGLVAVEIGAGQLDDVSDLFRATGLFQRIEVINDYQGWPRVVGGSGDR